MEAEPRSSATGASEVGENASSASTSAHAPARVVIVDGRELVRVGISAVLTSEPGIELVAQAADPAEASARVAALRPDVVIVSLPLPGMTPDRFVAAIKAASPVTAVVVVGPHDEDELLEALRSGAVGFVHAEAAGHELVAAVRAAARGQASIDADLAARLLHRLATDRDTAPPALPEPLTPREREVLSEMAGGRTNREIAARLIVSVGTVKIHVEHILAKLGVADRTEAAVRGVELGLVGRAHEGGATLPTSRQ